MNLRIAKLRHGVSLTELLLLMSMYTIILSMCAVLLHRVMRVETDSRSFVDAERTSARLSRQFRQDARQATAVDADASKLKNDAFLKLQLPSKQTVEYRWVDGNVLRTVSHDGKTVARNEFAFEPSCKLTIREDESPRRVVLSIISSALDSTSDRAEQLKSYKAVPVGLYVEASIGRGVADMSLDIGQERAR
jgi:hypothetical protein